MQGNNERVGESPLITNMLYKKHNYLNKNIAYLISNEIIEYDIQSAGFNILKKYRLISDSKLRYLESLNKKSRQIQIGLYIRSDRELGRALNEKFIEVRKWFFENNELQEDDILSIKKDAIITTRRCHQLEWDNLQFIEKNVYTSYYYLNRYEFYYNQSGLDVKGISDENLELHREYMLDFLYTFAKMQEISPRKRVIDLVLDFSKYYKSRKLNVGYYRELNTNSLYRLKEKYFGEQIGMNMVGDSSRLEIGYNYNHYLIPLISLLT